MLTGADDIMAENDLTLSFLQCQKIFSRLAFKHLFEHIEIQILTENYYAKCTQSIVPFVVGLVKFNTSVRQKCLFTIVFYIWSVRAPKLQGLLFKTLIYVRSPIIVAAVGNYIWNQKLVKNDSKSHNSLQIFHWNERKTFLFILYLSFKPLSSFSAQIPKWETRPKNSRLIFFKSRK